MATRIVSCPSGLAILFLPKIQNLQSLSLFIINSNHAILPLSAYSFWLHGPQSPTSFLSAASSSTLSDINNGRVRESNPLQSHQQFFLPSFLFHCQPRLALLCLRLCSIHFLYNHRFFPIHSSNRIFERTTRPTTLHPSDLRLSGPRRPRGKFR